MQQQLCAFFYLPQRWKQTPDKTPDNDPSSSSSLLRPHFSLTSCPTNHFFPFQLQSSFSSVPPSSSPALTQSPSVSSSPPSHFSPLLRHLSHLHLSPPLRTSFSSLQRFFVALLAPLCLLPSPAEAWFRVGVVGPWGCDPLFAKALPSVAAQLAVNRINKDPSLSYAATFDYAVLQVHH